MAKKQPQPQQPPVIEECNTCINNLGEVKECLIKCKEYQYLVVINHKGCKCEPSKYRKK